MPLFRNTTDRFHDAIVLRLHSLQVAPGEIIFTNGDMGSEIYFILRGQVNIYGDKDDFVYATLYDGNYLGENAFIKGQERRMFTAKARTW